MHAKKPVTVININSPSYTGTTWLCLLLGSHPRAFALGAPDRVWRLRPDDGGNACRVHGADCPFWPSFLRTSPPPGEFYARLAEASGRDVIVINNPSAEHEAAELRHPDLVVEPVRLVRDGRALAGSYARHHDVDYYDAVVRYVRKVYDEFPFDPAGGRLDFRYEDLLRDQAGHLARCRDALGIDYTPDASRFWEFEHHITAGNAGAISLLKALQGLDVREFRNRPFYREQYERMRDEGGAFLDERWRDELGRRERFVFDHFCGSRNAAWGYEEDAFTTPERAQFARELAAEIRPVRSRVKEAGVAALRAGRRRLGESLGRLSRSRRRLLFVGLVGWLASLAATWLLATWLASR